MELSACPRGAPGRSQRFVDNFSQAFFIVRRHGDFLPIHKDHRRPIDPERFTAVLVGRNSPGHFLALDVRLEALEIESQLGGVIVEIRADVFRRHPRIAIPVKRIMHFPETTLQPRGLRRSRRIKGIPMFLQGMFPEYDHEPFTIGVLEFFQDRPHERTRQAFEVAELFQLNRSRGVAAQMRRFRTGTPVNGPGRCSGPVMKKQETSRHRHKDHSDDDEKRK